MTRLSRRAEQCIAVLAGLIGLTGFIAFIAFLSDSTGIEVVIQNDGAIPLRDGHVWFRVGVAEVPTILPGQSASVTVHASEGDVAIEFGRTNDDYRHGHLLYVNNGDTGTIKARIDGHGNIHCRYRKAGPLLPFLWDPVEGSFAILTRPSTTPLVAPGSTMPPEAGSSPVQPTVSAEVQAIQLDHAPAKGPANAPVTLVEFCDFASSDCAKAVPLIDQILAAYPTQLRFVFKHYPSHDKSWLAHRAAAAAGEQGKFWEMHDLLFASQDSLDRDSLIAKANKLKLDLPRFEGDLDSPPVLHAVDADRQEGSRLHFFFRPASFLNGRFFDQPKDLADFKRAIGFAIEDAAIRQ